ncbi:DsbA family protein [Sphingomonas sp. TX0543]|uniref:DsbA family protein n=1 Tax=unclassified Sphingomonas TaxID=196159 RepID=UPI001484E9C1|nr:thioredoxin domain-containing protein [Sphingomonas sp. 3P27F8]
MRRLFPILALALSAPIVAAPRAWTSVAAPAAQGSYVIGNPAARVKLIEYASYTCPHCAHFTRDSAAILKGKMIASGSLSLEIRSSIHDRYDLVAAMLARCSGTTVFPRLHEALFARQDDWLKNAMEFDSANGQRLGLYSPAAQYRAMAQGAGLDAIARDAGMTQAAIDQCLADPAVAQAAIERATKYGEKIRGTPAFELNGKLIEGTDWAKLEPMLRAAGAK